jgi:uncharacterized protein with HEPN domain
LPFRDSKLLLQDILDGIAHIEDFVGNMEYADYLSSEKTQSAVERQLQIISEAAKRHGKLAAAWLRNG